MADVDPRARWTRDAVSVLLALMVAAGAVARLTPDALADLSVRFGPSTRLLLLAPHPDDESIAAAGLIRRVKASGGAVRVVLMTSGDAFPEGVRLSTHRATPQPHDYRAYSQMRERETTTAMQRLGVDRAHILFLGFPDGGLCLIASSYLSAKARAFESPYSLRSEPPASEQMIRGVTYRGGDIRRELESIITAFQPTVVAFPTIEDVHPDHCATSIFAREALNAAEAGARGRGLTVLRYLVHADDWPNLQEDTAAALEPPAGFPATEGEWHALRLTADERALKQRALAGDYPSQLLVIGRFLAAFARPNELFLEGRSSTKPECWCDDTHVATETPAAVRPRRRPKGRR
jgi:LmbE family N-acetylglucosaminyl deacetylase